MADIEKVIRAWECCNPFNRKCKECPYEKDCYHDGISRHMVADALALLKAQDEIISELLKVGYPHGYENEEPWIVDYMQLITEVVRKAVRLRNGTD